MAGKDNEISASYVSPILRWSFAREDRPDRTLDYTVIPVAESGVHPAFVGDTEWFIRATIHTPGEPDAEGLKAVPKFESRWVNRVKQQVPAEMDHEALVVLQTKALGRACKALGYPDDLADFRAMVLWRQRNREVALLGTMPLAALPAAVGQTEAKLDEAMGRAAQPVAAAGPGPMSAHDVLDVDSSEPTDPAKLSDDDITVIGAYAAAVANLVGPAKGKLAKHAFEQHGQGNILTITDPEICEALLNWLEDQDRQDSGLTHDE